MSRAPRPLAYEPAIPAFLWIATAALLHILSGGGAEQVAERQEGKVSLSRFAVSVRRHLIQERQPMEIALWTEETAESPDQNVPGQDQQVVPPEPVEAPEPEGQLPASKPAPPPEPQANPELTPEPQPEKPKEKPELPPAIAKQLAIAVPRISVRQHAAPDQADNPNARFIADEANHVHEETQARVTSTDQGDPNPTPGGKRDEGAPGEGAYTENGLEEPGNAPVTDVAQSETAPGDPERTSQSTEAEREARGRGSPQTPVHPKVWLGEPGNASESAAAPRGGKARGAVEEQEARAELRAVERAPGVLGAPGEAEPMLPEQEARAAQALRAAMRARDAMTRGTRKGSRGRHLNPTPGGMDPNLTSLAALDTLGRDALDRERLADGARRRSKHRGAWRPAGIERWRSAIENYVPTVRLGNQTALNAARSPGAGYLNQFHSRLHPRFAEDFLGSLDGLPGSDPLNNPELMTRLEIVLSREDGSIRRMGVARPSGSTVFDVAALEAVQRAAPFGAPPRAIVSPDGNVYLHWEFRRNEAACMTAFAHLYMLRVNPEPAPVPAPPAAPEPLEEGRRGQREAPERSREPGG